MISIFSISMFFFCFSLLSQSAKVISIKDGDTIVVLDENMVSHTIRLADIDCPEKSQPYGNVAKMFTSYQVFGKEVFIDKKSIDKYGRIVGFVLYEGKNLSLELLKHGMAWHYSYFSDDEEMAKLEKIARKNKVGLWADETPFYPALWRSGEGN